MVAPTNPAHKPSLADDRMKSAVLDTGCAWKTRWLCCDANTVYAAARLVEPSMEYCSVAFAPMGSGRLGTSLCCPSPVKMSGVVET